MPLNLSPNMKLPGYDFILMKNFKAILEQLQQVLWIYYNTHLLFEIVSLTSQAVLELCVAKHDLGFIILPLPPECWGYKCILTTIYVLCCAQNRAQSFVCVLRKALYQLRNIFSPSVIKP